MPYYQHNLFNVLFNEGEKERQLVEMRNKVVTCREPEISTLKGTSVFYLDDVLSDCVKI